MPIALSLLPLLLAYLLGSIPFGLLLTRAAGMGDIRKEGSGNIGATNVARVGGKKLGIAVLLLDMGKGALAVGLIPLLMGNDAECYMEYIFLNFTAPALALYAVILGHVFPVWLKFRGGKGVATLFGGLLALHWPAGLAFALAWLLIYFTTRYVSLASILAAGAVVAYACFAYGVMMGAVLFAPLFLLILFTHRSNIKRLLNGTEHRFGRTKS